MSAMSYQTLPLYLLALMLIMALAWFIQRKTGNSGWIDTIWSAGTGLTALVAIWGIDGDPARRAVAAVAIALWSLRLAGHIAARSAGAREDPRYAALAEEWGSAMARRLFQFLQIQAMAAFVLVVAVQASVSYASPFGSPADVVFILLAASALAGEAVSDRQLATCRRKGAGGICETGLWAHSRHPNYFFEWLFWCAWPFLAVSAGCGLPLALSLLAPVMMYALLVHVSGIPPLEAHMLKSRGAAFEAYQRRVNAFFPGPRRDASPGKATS